MPEPTSRREGNPVETGAPERKEATRPADAGVERVLALQRSAGNAAVARMLQSERAAVPAPDSPSAQPTLWDRAKGVAGAIGDAVSSAASGVSTAWDTLSDKARQAWAGISGAAAFVAKWGMEVLRASGHWISDLITEAPERIWRLLVHVGSGLVGTLNWMWKGLRGAVGHVWGGLVQVADWLRDGVTGLFQWVWRGLRGGASWAKRVLDGDFDALREGFSGLLAWVGAGAKGLAAWAWDGLSGVTRWASTGIGGFAKWLAGGWSPRPLGQAGLSRSASTCWEEGN